MYEVYVCATNVDLKGFKQLQESAARAGVEIRVLGAGEKWGGWRYRMSQYRMAAHRSRADYIVFADAYDVLVHPKAKEKLDLLVQQLSAEGTDLLVGAESWCGNNCLPIDHWHNGEARGEKFYVNAGCMIGKPKALEEMYDWMLQRHPRIEDDQIGVATYMNLFGKAKVKLDMNERLVTNFTGRQLLSFQLAETPFSHFPGGQPKAGFSFAYNKAIRSWTTSTPPVLLEGIWNGWVRVFAVLAFWLLIGYVLWKKILKQ